MKDEKKAKKLPHPTSSFIIHTSYFFPMSTWSSSASASHFLATGFTTPWSFSTLRLAMNHSLANASKSAAGSKVQG